MVKIGNSTASTSWPELTAAGAQLPFLSEALAAFTGFVEQTLYLLLLFTGIDLFNTRI